MLTLAEAAKETGLTKPAIFKSIQKGRISAKKDEKGQWLTDPAELFRVYPPATKKATVETHTGNFELLLKLKEMEAKLAVTEQRLLDKEAEIAYVPGASGRSACGAGALAHPGGTHYPAFDRATGERAA